MPVPSRISPVTGSDVASKEWYIHSDDSTGWFRDVHGRNLLLRGINLASSAKTPVGQPAQQLQGFWESAESGDVSFVNRVLDLDVDSDGEHSADSHLKRLKSWGFNCLRYVTTWESIEHKGPGQYDEEYIQYTIRMLRKCKEYGFRVYMDPHQDLWSRFSGGDGAPFWTLPACGLNPRNFTETNAAVIQCEWPHPSSPDPDNFPDMIWASNYTRLAVATLMTLFFSGKKFAPKCQLDGENIQDFLQRHYIAAYRHLAEAIRDAGDLYDTCVIGWDSMNEPNHGFVGLEDFTVQPASNVCKIGPMPTAFEAMKLGMGIATDVESWKFGSLGAKKEGNVRIDPKGRTVWLSRDADIEYSARYGWKRSAGWDASKCVWAQHGVWDVEKEVALVHDYFANARTGFEYAKDGWQPHWLAWAKMIREMHPEAIHFALPPVFAVPPSFKYEDELVKALSKRAVLSTHFYDGLTLITKHWNWFNADALGILRGKYASIALGVRVGESAIRKCMRDQLGYLRQDTFDCMGTYPTMMGEIGIPYDLDKKQAYNTGDYHNQSRAMDASMNACDGSNIINYSIWTYNPENTHRWGENWNGEDLSVWSLDDVPSATRSVKSAPSEAAQPVREHTAGIWKGLNAGSRAIESFVRPYPQAMAGMPVSLDFDVSSSRFVLVIDRQADLLAPGSENVPTEIFLPDIHYGGHTPAVSPTPDASRGAVAETNESASRHGHLHLPHIHNPFHHKRSALVSVKVDISHGRYEIEGNILRWYHDPLSVSTPSRQRIQITRQGGPRKDILLAYGEKPPSLAQALWDQLCAPFRNCCIS